GLFGIFYALVSNAVIPVGAFLAERYLYLPSIGLCIAAGSALEEHWRPRGGLGSLVARWGTVAGLAGLDAWSAMRGPIWRDWESVARAIVAGAPGSAVGHNNLGTALRLKSGVPEAERKRAAESCFATALSIYPEYPEAMLNYSAVLVEQGRHSEA